MLKSFNKFNSRKVNLDGYSFASKLEAAVYGMLKIREIQSQIKILQVQCHIYLTDARILYIADFKCEGPDKVEFYVEAKGFETDVWRIKRRLWKHYGPGKLEIWGGTHKRPFLKETLGRSSHQNERKL